MGTSYAEFRGKRALITGGTQGIGKAVARRLGENGALLFLNYGRNDEAAKETLTEFRSQNFTAELCKADLGSSEAVDRMLAKFINPVHSIFWFATRPTRKKTKACLKPI